MTIGLAAVTAPSFAKGFGCDGMGRGDNFSERRSERMQQRHQQLHDVLKLSAEQEGAWKTYAESVKPPARPKGNRDDWKALSAPERAEKRLEFSSQHQERMREHVAAMKAFYATLTPEQKKIFDTFHQGPRGGRRGPPQGDGVNQPPAAKS